MSNAPFKIGDEVVALKTVYSDKCGINKGDVYIVVGMHHCCRWYVDISQFQIIGTECQFCGDVNRDRIAWFNANNFAPISRTKYTIKEVEVEPAIREMEVVLS